MLPNQMRREDYSGCCEEKWKERGKKEKKKKIRNEKK